MFLLCCALLLSACGRTSAPPPGPFDGEKAYAYAKAQLDFGPRIPGSDGHRRAGDWIAEQVRRTADSVIEQRWTHRTAQGDSLPLRNIFARYRPTVAERVLFVTHWDTRPRADSDPDPAKRALPVAGANDGASGVGILIALGDLLKKVPPTFGVDLLFVDGEDYGEFGPPEVDVLLGSKYFAEHLPSPEYKILFGVLLDMVGDADLQLYQENNSIEQAPEVVTRVWQNARDLGLSRWFVPTARWTVTDDHIPLLKKGLRVIDVIDLDYSHHHTTTDTLDKISAQSLKIVGDVMYSLVR